MRPTILAAVLAVADTPTTLPAVKVRSPTNVSLYAPATGCTPLDPATADGTPFSVKFPVTVKKARSSALAPAAHSEAASAFGVLVQRRLGAPSVLAAERAAPHGGGGGGGGMQGGGKLNRCEAVRVGAATCGAAPHEAPKPLAGWSKVGRLPVACNVLHAPRISCCKVRRALEVDTAKARTLNFRRRCRRDRHEVSLQASNTPASRLLVARAQRACSARRSKPERRCSPRAARLLAPLTRRAAAGAGGDCAVVGVGASGRAAPRSRGIRIAEHQVMEASFSSRLSGGALKLAESGQAAREKPWRFSMLLA